MTRAQVAGQLFGYGVLDASDNKIGPVDYAWLDDATNALEFIGVKTGWFMGTTHIVPAANAQISDADRSIKVPYTADQIKDAPSFAGDPELSPEDEEHVYRYYGIDRSTGPSPSGLLTGEAETGPTADIGTEEERLRLHEEELQVGKRPVEAGRLRLRKVVRTETRRVGDEVRREDIEVDREPPGP